MKVHTKLCFHCCAAGGGKEYHKLCEIKATADFIDRPVLKKMIVATLKMKVSYQSYCCYATGDGKEICLYHRSLTIHEIVNCKVMKHSLLTD